MWAAKLNWFCLCWASAVGSLSRPMKDARNLCCQTLIRARGGTLRSGANRLGKWNFPAYPVWVNHCICSVFRSWCPVSVWERDCSKICNVHRRTVVRPHSPETSSLWEGCCDGLCFSLFWDETCSWDLRAGQAMMLHREACCCEQYHGPHCSILPLGKAAAPWSSEAEPRGGRSCLSTVPILY